MGALCGIITGADAAAVRGKRYWLDCVSGMTRALKHRGDCKHLVESDQFVVAGTTVDADDEVALLDGWPRDNNNLLLDVAGLRRRVLAARRPRDMRLRGAFAAAVQDGATWWLLRDRLGVKPLYYCVHDGALLFASELKALLASGAVSKHLNLASVDRYLTLRCVPGPDTILQGVYRVKPGHALSFKAGRIDEIPFSAFPTDSVDVERDEAAEQLQELLRRAVEDAETEPMLWSAGIDCASLAVLHAKRARPVFVTLKSAWQDERWRAKESARLIGLDLNVARARALTETAIGRVAYHLDEPIADPSVLPLWLIAEQAGKTAPLLLSGHGADEMLGGYPRYHYLQKARKAKRLVPVGLLQDIAPALPPNAFVRRGERYLTSLSDSLETYCSLVAVFDHAERNALYTDAMRAAIHEKGGSSSIMRPLFAGQDLSRDVLSLDLNVALPDLLLAKCDRLFAAHGSCLAFPYLGDALVDFA
ncbi:MAG: asparagine synthase-related protein, partial [Candidatus Hydrogenedentes bacterium]|nr:asparagine synthase-related protein [Candidatus Hydrogenedentota bacterium]